MSCPPTPPPPLPVQQHTPNRCTYTSSTPPLSRPIPYNSPPQSDPTILAQLAQCSFSHSTHCCDMDQAYSLVSGVMALKKIVNDACPACFHNLAQFMCEFACSPQQSMFTNITGVANALEPPCNSTQVTSANVKVDRKTANGIFASCEKVKSSSIGPIMKSLFDATNTEQWLYSLGHNERAPITVTFQLTDDDTTAMTIPDLTACSDPNPMYTCSTAQCPTTPDRYSVPPISCNVGVMSCYGFGIMILYISLALIGLLLLFNGPKIKKYASSASQYLMRKSMGQRISSGPIALPVDEDSTAELVASPDYSVDPHPVPPGIGVSRPREYKLHNLIQRGFYRLGFYCAKNPWLIVGISISIIGFLSLGWIRFAVETDPMKLWVSPSSATSIQKQYYDDKFGPFYRIEQVLLTVTGEGTVQNISDPNVVGLLAQIQDDVVALNNGSLHEICFSPLSDGNCAIQSILGWYNSSGANCDPHTNAKNGAYPCTYMDNLRTLQLCSQTPLLCLPKFKQPLTPSLVLGGYKGQNYETAQSLALTIVVKNPANNDAFQTKAKSWESSFISYLKSKKEELDLQGTGIRLSFMSESSIENELSSETDANVLVIFLSYLIMFLYASLALGKISIKRLERIAIDSKFLLGIGGIMIVLGSVSASVGIFSVFGVKTTLIIAEVIPFLVLAIGVDNIFIIVYAFQEIERRHSHSMTEHKVAATMAEVGPSILISSLSQTIAFGLGGAVQMPAISTFAGYASVAILADFLFQITCFVALLALDARRTADNRMDCLPCISLRAPPVEHRESYMRHFVREYFAPNLLRPYVRRFVLVAFSAMSIVFSIMITKLEYGLDQRIALPRQSYMIDYFDTMEAQIRTGPPLYFIINNVDFASHSISSKLCGRFPGCADDSIYGLISAMADQPNTSYVAATSDSWIDDYYSFLKDSEPDQPPSCCRLYTNGTIIPVPELESMYDTTLRCSTNVYPQRTLDSFPSGKNFSTYLSHWRTSVLDETTCLQTGSPLYDSSITMLNNETIEGVVYRTFHTPLTSQKDFINAYTAAVDIAKEMQNRLGGNAEVFPYSIFYVFFEQYLHIGRTAVFMIFSALAAIMVVLIVLTGNFVNPLLVVGTVLVIIVNMLGVMSIWGINLNGVSLVNLVICVGISVEFCSHVVKAFSTAGDEVSDVDNMYLDHGPVYLGGAAGADQTMKYRWLTGRTLRSYTALTEVGSSVFAGITITKFLGTSILFFSQSRIFEVYYFRMYLCMVLFGFSHGLIFLPVLLSYVGSRHILKEKKFGLSQDLLAELEQD